MKLPKWLAQPIERAVERRCYEYRKAILSDIDVAKYISWQARLLLKLEQASAPQLDFATRLRIQDTAIAMIDHEEFLRGGGSPERERLTAQLMLLGHVLGKHAQ